MPVIAVVRRSAIGSALPRHMSWSLVDARRLVMWMSEKAQTVLLRLSGLRDVVLAALSRRLGSRAPTFSPH